MLPKGSSSRKLIVRATLSLAVLVIAGEILSLLALRAKPAILGGLAVAPARRAACLRESVEQILADDPSSLAEFDAVLGWRARASNPESGVNEQRVRSARVYAEEPAAGTLRIAAFGDSFVFGSEVDGASAWPSLMEAGDAGIEVINCGVPGYGQDQVTMRLLAEGQGLHPRVVLLGVATPTLDRILTVSEILRNPGTLTHHFICKPRFVLDARGQLAELPMRLVGEADLAALLEDPQSIRELGRDDFWYEPVVYENWLFQRSAAFRLGFSAWARARQRYLDPDRPIRGASGAGVFNTESSAFTILMELLKLSARSAAAWGARPIVVLLPDGYSVERALRGVPGILDPVGPACAAAGLEVVDLTEALVQACRTEGLERVFIHRFHYTPLGNRAVAERLLGECRTRAWLPEEQNSR
jgi:hypothetical protein